jgi:hypothetical protein
VRSALVVWILLLIWPLSLAAQRVDEPLFAPEDTVGLSITQPAPPNDGGMVLAGMGGLILGALGGGFIGVELDGDYGLDAAEGAIIGGLIGTSLAIPTAMHLANGSRGKLARSVLVSALTGGAILGVGLAAESGEIVLAAPVVQLITSFLIERRLPR